MHETEPIPHGPAAAERAAEQWARAKGYVLIINERLRP
jgi:hypothetical protein